MAISETDYKAVCSVADVEDFGVNFYSGTIVIDGITQWWFAYEDPERVGSYGGRLKVDGVAISKRKDYNAIHTAVTEACRETIKLMYPQRSEPQHSPPQPSGAGDFENGGLTMEDILGPAKTEEQSQ